jgi:hypothetical protein
VLRATLERDHRSAPNATKRQSTQSIEEGDHLSRSTTTLESRVQKSKPTQGAKMSTAIIHLRTQITKVPASLSAQHRGKTRVVQALTLREPGAHVWNRVKGESGEAFRAFVAYRDLPGKRSIRKAAEIVGKSHQLLERWSACWSWVSRVAAFDDEILAVQDELAPRSVLAMRRRHAQAGAEMVGKAGESVRALDPTKVSVRDAVALLKTGVDIERQAFGLSDEAQNVPHSNRPTVGVLVQGPIAWMTNPSADPTADKSSGRPGGKVLAEKVVARFRELVVPRPVRTNERRED